MTTTTTIKSIMTIMMIIAIALQYNKKPFDILVHLIVKLLLVVFKVLQQFFRNIKGLPTV